MSNSAPPPTPALLPFRPRAFPLGAAPWAARLDVETALMGLEGRPGLVCLDSAGGSPARWSLIAFDPLVSFEGAAAPADLDGLAAELARLRLDPRALEDPLVASSPFCGGFIGALAYDLGVRGEDLDLPPPEWPAPPIVGGLHCDWLLIEPEAGDATLFLSDAPGRAPATERSAAILGALEAAVRGPRASALAAGEPAPADRAVPAEEHMARIDRTRALIEAGEIYQANVAHRLHVAVGSADVDLYRTLRAANPAPYMGLCRFRFSDGAAGALLSSSPELLLELGPDERGDRVARTRPIKGTAPRGHSPAEDAASRARLLASDKDLAELAMIVDLERNDLGRVAEAGGVEVRGFPTLESYASVHHLVADVRARPRPEATAIDVIGALFPGGSITGAPKLRSMEAIAALEREGRGFFTGSLGFVDARGRALLNILIRTLVHRETDDGREVSLHVGGGITWRSDPALEDEETGHKADGLLRALAPHVIERAMPHGGDLHGGRPEPLSHTQR
ncbi:MAG: anthranilate synthase component I family protein [Planctomycetota bacterium]|nr:anthranilate synthase component I family protein [Planctomycetota bacterium]